MQASKKSYSAIADEEGDEEGLAEKVNVFLKKGGAPPTDGGLAVTFKDLSYVVVRRRFLFSRTHTTILQGNVTGYVTPGTMLLLMGPTGSGKSTLLSLLACRARPTSGDVSIGGRAPTARFARRSISFMEQQDSLHDMLTVHEMLCYTGELKLQRSVPFHRKRQRVEELEGLLQLEGLRGSKCKALSSGERRRVELATALLLRPRALLLDEPGRASDAAAQDVMVEVLQAICTSERLAVVVAATQPTSYALERFDLLMLLVGGSRVYFGDPRQAADYFAGSGFRARPGDSPAESAAKAIRRLLKGGTATAAASEFDASPQAAQACERVDILSKGGGAGNFGGGGGNYGDGGAAQSLSADQVDADVEAAGQGITHGDPDKDDVGRSDGKRGFSAGDDLLGDRTLQRDAGSTVTPFWWALLMLWRYRALHNYLRLGWLAPRLLDKLLFAVIIGLLFQGAGSDVKVTMLVTVPAANFLFVVIPAFSAICCLPSLFAERRSFYQERDQGLYSTATYLCYKLSEELLFVAIYSLGLSAIVFYMCGMRGSFVLFWLVYFAVNAVSIAFTMMVAALSRVPDVATIMVPTFGWLMLFFAGFFLAVGFIPSYLRWLSYLDHLRYGFSAVQENHWQQMDVPIIGDSIAGKIGDKVDELVVSLPDKLGIPFLQTSDTDATPAPDEGFFEGLFNDLKSTASDTIKDVAGSVAGTAVEAVSDVSIDAVMNKLNTTVHGIMDFSGRANETIYKVFNNLEQVTYGDVALALYDFQQPYNPWVNCMIQWMWFLCFTVLTFLAMAFIRHDIPS